MIAKTRLLALCVGSVLTSSALASSLSAAEPIYSLDLLVDHPYRFLPPYGHASQLPGSPKYFEPGYGYRIPGFGKRTAPTTYRPSYAFGHRLPTTLRTPPNRYNRNSLGGPWYHPGWPGNLQDQSW